MSKEFPNMKILATLALVLVAIGALSLKYMDYLTNPWTRDGMVRANVIQVTPRISGPIIELSVVDNQLVKKGEPLFKIDPRTFQADLDEAQAELIRTEADFERGKRLTARGDISERDFDKSRAAYEVAKADLKTAQLNLEFTSVNAAADGYITNLTLRIGSQAVANQPVMALIDSASFWVHGFFRETIIKDISAGDRAIVTLLSHTGEELTGTVDSLGWGIAQQDGSTGIDLLPSVNPTFEWIRLAQRIPVRIQLDPLPEGVELRVGTTASVLVETGTANQE